TMVSTTGPRWRHSQASTRKTIASTTSSRCLSRRMAWNVSMIPKSGNRFSDKHALGLDPRDHAQKKLGRLLINSVHIRFAPKTTAVAAQSFLDCCDLSHGNDGCS